TNAPASGRRSRVVLMPRRWHQALRMMIRESDGGKKARSPGRARRKPLKPFARGMPGEAGVTVVDNSCAFLFCMRGCGRIDRPAFPAPLISRAGQIRSKLGRPRREIAQVWPVRCFDIG